MTDVERVSPIENFQKLPVRQAQNLDLTSQTMSIENILTRELMESASLLESRFRMLNVPTWKVPIEEWNSLPSNIQKLVPNWIPILLANYALTGAILECLNKNQRWPRYFWFNRPADYEKVLEDVGDTSLEQEVLNEGLVPISDENNGDMWVTSISGGPQSPIYLYQHSGGDKLFASSRISLLMASMAVSEKSFELSTWKKVSVMWYPEK